MYDDILNANVITHEDLIDFYASLAEPTLRRSKTRMDIKREVNISMDDKRSKLRTPNRTNNSRNIKSAPTMPRSKSQLVVTTKRKERNINSSRPVQQAANPVYKYLFLLVDVRLVFGFVF